VCDICRHYYCISCSLVRLQLCSKRVFRLMLNVAFKNKIQYATYNMATLFHFFVWQSGFVQSYIHTGSCTGIHRCWEDSFAYTYTSQLYLCLSQYLEHTYTIRDGMVHVMMLVEIQLKLESSCVPHSLSVD
jgi:hypothetical protein